MRRDGRGVLGVRRALGALLVVLATALTVHCGGVQKGAPPSPGAPGSAAPRLARALTPPDAALVFPPPEDGWHARPELGRAHAGTPLRVVSPSLDADGSFALDGQTLRIALSQPVVAEGEPADLVRLTPAVLASVRWLDPTTLELTARAPFDPEVDYEVELGSLHTAAGQELEAPWHARFRAQPRVIVAGKVLGYLPRVGEPRVVALVPRDGATVGRDPGLGVVFDQPIDLAVARGLVELVDARGGAVPLGLAHPPGRSFDGIALDTRLVVTLAPARPLMPGGKYVLRARDRAAEADVLPAQSGFEVATPLELVALGCGYGNEHTPCARTGDLLRTGGRELHFTFNHELRAGAGRVGRELFVVPPVPNLAVESHWDDAGGRLVVRGDFEPSGSYRVRLAGVGDVFGGTLAAPVDFALEVLPVGASAVMPEGVLFLDERASRHFPVTTRNASEAVILAWPVAGDDAAAYRDALRLQADRAPDRARDASPTRIAVPVAAVRDALVTTEVDLTGALARGRSYLATVAVGSAAFGAPIEPHEPDSAAARPATALVRLGMPGGLAVHARSIGPGADADGAGSTLVHVARLATGEPVAGATVALEGATGATLGAPPTDDRGLTLVPLRAGHGALVRVTAGAESLVVPLTETDASAATLFPALAAGEAAGERDLRALVITDRGIYRPGSEIGVRVSVLVPTADGLAPLGGAALVLRVVGPTDDVVASLPVTLDDLGGGAVTVPLGSEAAIGRYELRLEVRDDPERPVARATVQVAEFEAPRFVVDVELGQAAPRVGGGTRELAARVRGRYLFGGAMSAAPVRWSLRRSPAPLGGSLVGAGLAFVPESDGLDGEPAGKGVERSGEAVLGADGSLGWAQPVDLRGAVGPQRFTLEASVTDESGRVVAGRQDLVAHPAARYAGLRLSEGWVNVGADVGLELGVADPEGAAVVGADVSARIERVAWRAIRTRGAGGALETRYRPAFTEVGRCRLRSEAAPVRCSYAARAAGDYRVVAEVDGQPGGTASFWVYDDADEGDGDGAEGGAVRAPRRGSTIELRSDKALYAAGDRARVLVRNPYPAATAILTLEQGGLLATEVKRGTARAFVFEVPIRAEHAPHVHAVVTLLPAGASDARMASYRIGAVRLPVSLAASRLAVAIEPEQTSYRPGDEAVIAVRVKDGAAPDAHAEVSLAVVDEGVLRLTGHEAPDPVSALHPPRPLAFGLTDTRSALGELYATSHVAGDGGGDVVGTIGQARKDFVATALWEPRLRTDADGVARVRFKLPDNLTELRITAVVVDAAGKGARARTSIVVQKPWLVEPVVPRFVHAGDELELGAMVHNTTREAFQGTLTFGALRVPVAVAPEGRTRVAVPLAVPADAGADTPLTLDFALEDASGAVQDRVLRALPVARAGLALRPRLAGAFRDETVVTLALPAELVAARDASLRIVTGEHLWPELGRRLEYLLEYPHGCVEQTTSSTLPLIAARDILPRIGLAPLGRDELDRRIAAGLARLATMRTASGGLAYWPGESEPNVYGTAYAIRAVVRARALGVTPPRGLLEGMRDYLAGHLFDRELPAEVGASIAESLAELDALPASAADALWDRRTESGLFGQAALALALAKLPAEEARVAALVAGLEDALGSGGLSRRAGSHDYRYYGSPARTRAEIALALGRLRPRSAALPDLYAALARLDGAYSTQATAFSLLALAEELSRMPAAGVPVALSLDGAPLVPARELAPGSFEYRVPLAELRGRRVELRFVAPPGHSAGFALDARYELPDASLGGARSSANGPAVYRVFTDAKGAPIDLGAVHVGDVVRVALMARIPAEVAPGRRGYLALTDALPAGFEPLDPTLATVGQVPDLGDDHPFAAELRHGATPSHLELRDRRVDVYFDELSSDTLAASYLARATTPGRFALPPASAELMYEPGSLGHTEGGTVVVR
ncbi:MAG: hypothetical protein IT373_10015 [Polyangiaceae bacterium]|nr:hypothetical protein [Polyangiaceae bacterium]